MNYYRPTALVALCAVSLAGWVDARHNYETSTAAYRVCV